MRIAYVVSDENREDVGAHVLALTARGHEVDVLDEPAEDYDVTVDAERALAIAPIVPDEFYRARNPAENEPLRVLLAGASHVDARGIEEGYGAVAHARWFHQKFDLIRISPWAPSREEPLDDVQEFHVGLDLRERARLIHTCDVLVAPDRVAAPFSLVVAEALASGVPVVTTSTPSNLAIDPAHDFASFAPPENPVELGEKLIAILTDFELRDRLRERGRVLAERWRTEALMDRLEAFLVENRSVRQR